jgi:glucose/arabinose dehydrogenase
MNFANIYPASLALVSVVLALSGLSVPVTAQPTAAIAGLAPIFEMLPRGFDRPIAMVQAPGRPDRWYVAEQAGRIFAFDNRANADRIDPVADLRARVASGPNEAGLLGFAFHPSFSENREVFLSYTVSGTVAGGDRRASLVSVISRFTMTGSDRLSLDPASEQIILSLPQPFGNHNGGHIAFGPDGFLYAGFGDGGGSGDPRGNGQNIDTLLGTLIRIDVDVSHPGGVGGPAYRIPTDNPLVGSNGRPEIFAFGLRNPWRWNFDKSTGDLWLADVGQNRWEEVNVIVPGGNYGWNRREGAHAFDRSAGTRGRAGGQSQVGGEPQAGRLIDPVAEESHRDGWSITGGYVYRGAEIAALVGWYVYADFCSGHVWATRLNNGQSGNGQSRNGRPETRLLLTSDLRVASFAEGADGALYALDHSQGRIFRIVRP